MPTKSDFKPVLEEKDFSAKILFVIIKHEQKLSAANYKLSKFDATISKKVREIIRSNSDAGVMINSVKNYLNSAWSFDNLFATLLCNECLKDRLLNVVGELDKDHRIRSLTANNSKLASENQALKHQKAQSEKNLKKQHDSEVSELKKSATLDRKHLEKSVESLSEVVKTEVAALKNMMVGKDAEMRKLQEENARLLQLTSRLQQRTNSNAAAAQSK